jgi:secreted PhoX family phosphatase
VYRYVSRGRLRKGDLAHNRRLLEDGELSVARFRDDGRLSWLPLVHGRGPLTSANGFKSQADVVLDARRAADLLGATPMDRPEEVEVNPATGTVFVLLTGTRRPGQVVNAANPRSGRTAGHILELLPPDGDHAAPAFRWEILLLGGNPAAPEHQARFHADTGPNDWFAAPDNCTFDRKGGLWVTSDGMPAFGSEDGLFAVEVRGPRRGRSRRFLAVPAGTEPTGPCFTPDGTTLFLAFQVPNRGQTYDQPASRWPDFDPNLPPRPSVVAIRRNDGGAIDGA